MKLPREIWLMALIGFMSAIGLGLVVPSLPSLGAEYGVGIAAMTVAISGFAATRLATNLALTRLLRRIPLTPVLASGLAFQGVTTVIAGLADDYTTFIVFRILSGAGSAGYTIASTALMVAIAPSDKRGRATGVQSGAMGIGTVSGPALGGVVVLANPHLPLIVYGIGLILGAAVTIVLLRRVRQLRTIDEQAVDAADPEGAVLKVRAGSLRWLFSDSVFVTVIACQAVNGWVYYGTRSSILPAYLEGIGNTAAFVGILLAIAALFQLGSTAIGGPTSDRFGRFPLLIVSYIAGIGAFALMLGGANPIVAVLAFVALGIAGGAQQSTAGALLADSRGGRSANAVGVYWITFDVFAIVGPTVNGIVAEAFGSVWAIVLSGIVLVLALANVVRGSVRSRRTTTDPGG